MSMFTLAISCLTTSNLPWFMDLTFQVRMQYCSLQHLTLLLSPLTSTAGYSFCFGSIPSFFLELFLHWFPVAYWAPTDLGSFSFSILSFCLFIIGDWNAKVGSQETPGVTGKFGLGIWNEAGQRLIEFCQENALVIANTLFPQHKRRLYSVNMDITRWSTPKSDWLYSLQPKMEKLYTVSKKKKKKTRSRLWLRTWTPYCQIQT